jgi:hypothetical protein
VEKNVFSAVCPLRNYCFVWKSVCIMFVLLSAPAFVVFCISGRERRSFPGPPVKSTAVLHTGEEEETDREKKER